MTRDANILLFNIFKEVSNVDQPRRIELFDELLKLRSPIMGETSLMEILVTNLHDQSHSSNAGVVQIITLQTLELLFSCQPEKYTLDFECHEGCELLERLQYSPYEQIGEAAAGISKDFFKGECDDEKGEAQAT